MLDNVPEAERPVFDADKITPEQFAHAINTYSVVHIRNVVPADQVKLARQVVIETYREYQAIHDRLAAGEDVRQDMQYLFADLMQSEADLRMSDLFRSYGSIVLVNTNHAAAIVCEILENMVLMPHLTAYFGVRPMLALNASSVRMADITSDKPCLFHQDGTFLGGPSARTINTWIALDDCGTDAPGIEVIPRRVSDLLPAGKNVDMDWEILDNEVYDRFGGRSSGWIPQFQAGDVLAFDHMNIHRTHMTRSMTRNRHALECWMYPPEQRYRDLMLAAI